MNELTQWFKGDVKPVHVGYYQRKYGMKSLIKFPDYWDGAVWFTCGVDGEIGCAAHSNLLWRGLAVKP